MQWTLSTPALQRHQLAQVLFLRSNSSVPASLFGSSRSCSFSREAGRRRGRFDHPLDLRLNTCTQTVITRFHRKEKVRPVAVRTYPGAIDSESCRRRSNVDGNIVGPGSANYVHQCLASVWLCGWMLPFVCFDIEMNFIRPATRSCQRVYRGILSKGRRSKKQCNQSCSEHARTSL